MDDRDAPDAAQGSLSDLPLQPTGSGVADLEIAYEQMKLVEGDDATGARADDAEDIPPVGLANDAAESEAHPS